MNHSTSSHFRSVAEIGIVTVEPSYETITSVRVRPITRSRAPLGITISRRLFLARIARTVLALQFVDALVDGDADTMGEVNRGVVGAVFSGTGVSVSFRSAPTAVSRDLVSEWDELMKLRANMKSKIATIAATPIQTVGATREGCAETQDGCARPFTDSP
jgi:hypothetical protein